MESFKDTLLGAGNDKIASTCVNGLKNMKRLLVAARQSMAGGSGGLRIKMDI